MKSNSTFANPTKVITGVVRLSYANIWQAKSINGGAPKFSTSVLIPKTDTVTVNKVNAAIQAAYERFLIAYNKLMKSRALLLADCELIRKTLCDTSALDAEMCQQQDEMAVVAELMGAHVKKNASVAQSQTEYAAETKRIEKRYNDALERYNMLEAEKVKRLRKSKEIQAFTALLKSQPTAVTEWSERLWITLLDTATVMADGTIVFRFKSGIEIRA